MNGSNYAMNGYGSTVLRTDNSYWLFLIRFLLNLFYYRPQNEVWVKVIISQVSVILFTGGGGGEVGFPPCITGHMGDCIQGGLLTGGSALRWLGRPPPTGTRKAGGTHSTGMLSCLSNYNTHLVHI